MRMLFVLLAALPLCACVGNVRQAGPASLDLGLATVAWQPVELPLRGVEVHAPPWLATSAIQYRLLYADPLRRQAYSESRWVAPPAELAERALNRQTAARAAGCRLRLDIDEWIQVFDNPQQSRVLLELRASLTTARGDAVLARQAFAVAQPAAADARGGVQASAAALQSAAGEIGKWLATSAREVPAVGRECAPR